MVEGSLRFQNFEDVATRLRVRVIRQQLFIRAPGWM